MNSASPAHSSVSTTAVAGGGGSSGAAAGLDDFHFPPDIPSLQERKDEAMRVLKADLMGELDKEVKSLGEDNWKFDGPRSRIHLISRRATTNTSAYLSLRQILKRLAELIPYVVRKVKKIEQTDLVSYDIVRDNRVLQATGLGMARLGLYISCGMAKCLSITGDKVNDEVKAFSIESFEMLVKLITI